MNARSVAALMLLAAGALVRAETLKSPDGRLALTLGAATTNGLSFTVTRDGRPVLADSSFAVELAAGGRVGDGLAVSRVERTRARETWSPPWGERAVVTNHYEQFVLTLRDSGPGGRTVRLTARAYDHGVAFRYAFPSQAVEVARERTTFRFAGVHPAWATYSAQGTYARVPLGQLKPGAERPLTVEAAPDLVLALGEAALVDYPRMKFAPVAGASNAVVSHLDGPGRLDAGAESPWRVIQVADSPARLLEQNDLWPNLNEPCALADTSWIKPGKVLREVSLTTEGAQRCVDYMARHGMQYLLFDAGWYGHEYDDRADATGVHLDPKRSKGPLDLPAVIDYAKRKDIGVILYVNRRALEKQLDTLLPLYQQWGVKGVKYGFVNVGPQQWTAWLHDAVRKAAAHKLMVDIHDEYRPTGYSRTYPNLMTQEGIRGDEEASRTMDQTLVHLFTRCLSGPADNTFCYYDPRVDRLSTHAAQLAKTVCLFSPWQFLFWYDRPPAPGREGGANVLGEEPELAFWAALPTTWDETRVLAGRIGEFAAIARRSGRDWYVGVLQSQGAETYALPLDFLPAGTYRATMYVDDPAAPTRTKVAVREETVQAGGRITLPLRSPGGAAVRLQPLATRQ